MVTLPETPKLPVDPCPQLLPVPATPPKLPGPPPQAPPPTPASEAKKKAEPPAEVVEVPKALPADRGEQRRMLVEMCVRVLFLCLSRFPQHYKSLYRLAFFYTNSKTHQVGGASLSHLLSHHSELQSWVGEVHVLGRDGPEREEQSRACPTSAPTCSNVIRASFRAH